MGSETGTVKSTATEAPVICKKKIVPILKMDSERDTVKSNATEVPVKGNTHFEDGF